MAFITTLPGEMSGNEMVGSMFPRSLPDESPSVDEFSALTDVPLFVGYMVSYILSGIMLVQVFLYFLNFRRKDPRFMKLTVLALFILEIITSTIATVLVIYSIISKGYLSFSVFVPGFQALAVLSGVVSSMVHCFYCWRIRVLGGHWAIVAVIAMLSITQCVMVSVLGAGALDGDDVLGAGTNSYDEPYEISYNAIWLGGSALCDIMIATTILYLQNQIITKRLGKTSPLANRVERVMNITIDTGMITAIGATIELLLYLILRNSMVHFSLFYPLPKLYANCLLATLNARLVTPDKGFRESTFIAAELSDSEARGGRASRQTLPSSIQIKVQEATTYRNSVSSSVMDIKRRSASIPDENYLGLSFDAAATKRSSILDLKKQELHYHYDQDFAHHAKLPMAQQQQPGHSEFQSPPARSDGVPSSSPPPAYPNILSSVDHNNFVLPAIARHSVISVDLPQHRHIQSLQNRKSVGKILQNPHIYNPEHVEKVDTSLPPTLFLASSPNLSMPWDDSMPMESAIPTIPIASPPVQPSSLPTGRIPDVKSEVENHVPPVYLEPLRAPEASLQPFAF